MRKGGRRGTIPAAGLAALLALAAAGGACAAAAAAPSSVASSAGGEMCTRLRNGDITTTFEGYSPAHRRLSEGLADAWDFAFEDAIRQDWPLSNYTQYYVQLPKQLTVEEEVGVLRTLDGVRAVTVGFVPDNTWHVLLPNGAEEQLHAALPDARLVAIDSHQKLSPEWRAIHDLLRNDTSRDALVAGATVTQLLRESSGNLTHYIGALQVEQSPGRKPRVHVRVWFPHLTNADAARLGFNSSGELSPDADLAAKYAAALKEVIANATAANATATGATAANATAASANATGGSAGAAPGADEMAAARAEAAGDSSEVVRLVAMLSVDSGNGNGTSLGGANASAAGNATGSAIADALASAALGNATSAPPAAAAAPANATANATVDNCEPVVTSGHYTMDVLVCLEHVGPVLRWLSRQPMVYWLAPKMKHSWQNLAAGAITQGSPLVAAVRKRSEVGAAGLHPIWAAGLKGQGQIVGIGDSGVDVDSCYFYDPKVPFDPVMRDDSVGVFKSDTHRKIALYVGAADVIDSVGHGTHTSATIAGKRYDSDDSDPATGMAPEARLAIIDLSKGRAGYVSAPDDLSDGYFKPTYAAGARVHSDSWGSDVIVYDYSAASLDLWLWEHPDFVSVFAAGNYGTQEEYRTTITSPATSKNAIAVGATLTIGSDPAAGEDTAARVHTFTVTVIVAGSGRQTLAYRAVQAGFGGAVPRGKKLALAAASPADACGDVEPVEEGAVLLVRRGGCYFSSKLANAAAAGAAGVVLTNDKQEGYFQMESQDDGDTVDGGIFMVGVPLSTGRDLWNLLANSSATAETTLAATFVAPPTGLPSYEHLAGFSSYGPTQDGRIKPDVVAPGTLLSARSDGALKGTPDSCTVGVSEGTSMAAPVVSGSVALIRQYFTDGFYPSGAKNEANQFKPSGPLIKATLLGGAANMLGNTEAGLPLEPAPSFKQGFGRVNLTRSLPMKDNGWRMQVVDLAPITQGETHRYCIEATGGHLSVTLAWYDYPGSPAASGSMLVNNLDLEVRSAGLAGALLRGNGFADDLNTVERVTADDFPAGNVLISIVGKRIPAVIGSQKYALVVQGRFSGLLASKFNPAADAASAAPVQGEGECVLTVPVIDRDNSPPPLSKERAASIAFRSKSGVAPAAGFECKLVGKPPAPPGGGEKDAAVDDGGKAAAAGHDWKACGSPATYTLPDGRYVFSVRTEGEDASDKLRFAVDATPPVAQLSSSLGAPPPGAKKLSSAAANATFVLSAADASNATFECMLSLSGGRGPNGGGTKSLSATYGRASKPYARMPGAPAGAPAPPVGKWAPCASPLTLWGLDFGDWSLSVRASDAAGNVGAPVDYSWSTRYAPNERYARVANGSYGVVNTRNLLFKLDSFTGGPDGAPQRDAAGAAPVEWALLPAAGAAGAPDGAWQPGASAAVAAPGDGSFLFLARPASGADAPLAGALPDTWGVVSLTVDTTPPRVNITARPEALTSSREALVRFQAQPAADGDEFLCRWLHSGAAPPDPAAAEPAFGPCAGAAADDEGAPPAAGAGSAAANVTEGFWLFQARAVDAAGNMGPPANVTFRADLSPPAIVNVTYPNATNAGFVTVAFAVDDGPAGSGVADVSCRMALAAGAAGGGGKPPADAPAAPEGARAADGAWAPCTSPVSFLLPKDGRYLFQLTAVDKAQLKVGPKDFTVVRDTQAPTVRIVPPQAAKGGAKLPRRVSIEVQGRDASSGVVAAEGLLKMAQPKEPSSVVKPSSAPANGSLAGGAPAAGDLLQRRRSRLLRRLMADAPVLTQQLGKARVQGTGQPVSLDTWFRSGSPTAITIEDLPSGSYTLQARAVDAAGNVGPASEAVAFDVDSSLPLPEEAAAKRAQTLKLAIGIGAGVGGAVLIAALLAGGYYHRRSAVARKVAAEREAAARRQQWEEWTTWDAAARAAGGAAGGPAGGSGTHYAPPAWPGGEGQQLPSSYSAAAAGAAAAPPGWAAMGWFGRGGGAASPEAAAAAASGRFGDVDGDLLAELKRRDEEEARVRAAIDASLEEEALRKAIAASLGDAAAPARRGGTDGGSSVDAVVDLGGAGAGSDAPPAGGRRGFFSRRG